MIIDFKTGKPIPSDLVITITQSFTKSSDLVNRDGVDFINQENNNWKEILSNNEILSLTSILEQFQGVLVTLLNGGEINPDYCQFMLDQCKNWEISDKFIIIEQ